RRQRAAIEQVVEIGVGVIGGQVIFGPRHWELLFSQVAAIPFFLPPPAEGERKQITTSRYQPVARKVLCNEQTARRSFVCAAQPFGEGIRSGGDVAESPIPMPQVP